MTTDFAYLCKRIKINPNMGHAAFLKGVIFIRNTLRLNCTWVDSDVISSFLFWPP